MEDGVETSEEQVYGHCEDVLIRWGAEQEYAEQGLEEEWLKERLIHYKHEKLYKTLKSEKSNEYSNDDSRRIRDGEKHESSEPRPCQYPVNTGRQETTPLPLATLDGCNERQQEWLYLVQR